MLVLVSLEGLLDQLKRNRSKIKKFIAAKNEVSRWFAAVKEVTKKKKEKSEKWSVKETC